jgi:hypothetical protein
VRHGVGQFHPRVAFFNGLDANPATVGPLLDRAEDGGEVDLTRAEDHGTAVAGEGTGHCVGRMHVGDVMPQSCDGGHRIVVVHHQRTRHQMVLRGFPWLELASLRDATIR